MGSRPGSLELLLLTLNSTLRAYLEVLSLVKCSQSRVTTQLARVISDVCSACMPTETSDEMRELIRQTELLANEVRHLSKPRESE
jgi:hypothetical protein